tara:strand:+ start:1069 stop:2379 length:1311 start_codon:yes stop_codon:yes gene_type:complete
VKYFYGIVEDRQDPLKIGRVRVRVHGVHTFVKHAISTPDLPWAQVLLPTSSAGLSGFGFGNGLVEGSTVFGFWRDEEYMQDPVVIGVAAGIPAQGSRITIEDQEIQRTVEDGFNDPRRLTVEDYVDTPDGETPTHDRTRTFGLTTALDTAPKQPKTLSLKYDGTGSTITEVELTKDDLPYYPRYYEASDLNDNTTGIATYTHRSFVEVKDDTVENLKHVNTKEIFTDNTKKRIVDEEWGFPVSPAKPVYPYNKSTTTESGHIIEIDDTLGVERIAVEHRSGTFHEIHPDGSEVTRIVNDNYTVVAKDNKLIVGGNVDVSVEKGNVRIAVATGNADIYVAGHTDLMVDGNVNASIGGTLNADVVGNTTFTSPETLMTTNLTVDGTVHVTKTTHSVGDVSTDAGNAPTLATHKHKTTSMDTGVGSNAGKKNDSSIPDE